MYKARSRPHFDPCPAPGIASSYPLPLPLLRTELIIGSGPHHADIDLTLQASGDRKAEAGPGAMFVDRIGSSLESSRAMFWNSTCERITGSPGRGRRDPAISAVGLEYAGLDVIHHDDAEHALDDPVLEPGVLDREHDLDAAAEVARHPVGRREEDLGRVAVLEIRDP